MGLLIQEEDFPMFCQLPGFGSEWVPVVGLVLGLVGIIVLVSATWKRVVNKESGDRGAGFAEPLKAKNRKTLMRSASPREAQLSPDTSSKTATHFGRRAKKTVMLGHKRERGGFVVGSWTIAAGLLLTVIGSLPCP
jgi:hypothetical protein